MSRASALASENLFKVSCQDPTNRKQDIFRMKTTFIPTSWESSAPHFTILAKKKKLKVKNTELFLLRQRFYRKVLSFNKYLCLLPDNLAKCGVDNKQQKCSSEKKNFKCYGIKTRPAKNWQVLYSYKKLYSIYFDRNFSVNSYKNLLHSC